MDKDLKEDNYVCDRKVKLEMVENDDERHLSVRDGSEDDLSEAINIVNKSFEGSKPSKTDLKKGKNSKNPVGDYVDDPSLPLMDRMLTFEQYHKLIVN